MRFPSNLYKESLKKKTMGSRKSSKGSTLDEATHSSRVSNGSASDEADEKSFEKIKEIIDNSMSVIDKCKFHGENIITQCKKLNTLFDKEDLAHFPKDEGGEEEEKTKSSKKRASAERKKKKNEDAIKKAVEALDKCKAHGEEILEQCTELYEALVTQLGLECDDVMSDVQSTSSDKGSVLSSKFSGSVKRCCKR